MRNKNILLLLSGAFLMAITFAGCTPDAVTAGHIMFGKSGAATTSATGGADSIGTSPCNGRGICSAGSVVSPGFTLVSITLKDETPMKLLFTFSLQTLSENQPEQSRYFTSPEHTYNFEATYELKDPIFEPLHLPANSRITPDDKTNVRVLNGQVQLLVTFSHD